MLESLTTSLFSVPTHIAEKMRSEMAEYAKGVRGHVRLLANISAMLEFLPKDMSTFTVAYPQIRIDLQERVSAQSRRASGYISRTVSHM